MNGFRLVPASRLHDGIDAGSNFSFGTLDERVPQKCGLSGGHAEYDPAQTKIAQTKNDVAVYVHAHLHLGVMLDVDEPILRERLRDGRFHLSPDESKLLNDLFDLMRAAGVSVHYDGISIDGQVHGSAFQ